MTESMAVVSGRYSFSTTDPPPGLISTKFAGMNLDGKFVELHADGKWVVLALCKSPRLVGCDCSNGSATRNPTMSSE